MNLTRSVFIFVFLGAANAQIFSLGNCDPNIHTVPSLDISRHSGRWFEYKRTQNAVETNTKCFSGVYSVINDTHITIDGKFAYRHDSTKPESMPLIAKVDKDNSAAWDISPGFIADVQQLLILDTDYDNYPLDYSCVNVYKGKLELYWLLTRIPKPNEATIINMEKVLEKRNIHVDWILEENDCPWMNNLVY